ncbi:kinase-like protein [Neofusicoccum parvum]|uniref:Kinase-like protein n=1 Tax=Neofusicoccum parvum TaxID=310453 RepID=A0ACB5S6F4_9PEZI|nr:kinase-like protein [Neofusicoccum parvum]
MLLCERMNEDFPEYVQIDGLHERDQWRMQSGWTHGQDHHKFGKNESNGKFEVVDALGLGQGSLGSVQEIRVKGGKINIVRKIVSLPQEQGMQRKRGIVQNEAETLKRLEHDHIVFLIGTCEEVSARGVLFYHLLMAPVGDQDLAGFLCKIPDGDVDTQRLHRAWLCAWFSCLSSALGYIQSKGIRHEDIKPSNIIHRGSRIYFTDFGSSTRFIVGETTSTLHPARITMKYAAPESQHDFYINEESSGRIQRHGSRSDVFSLGCVFTEMLTVIRGMPLANFQTFCRNARTSTGFAYCLVLEEIEEWFEEVGADGDHRRVYEQIIKPMLSLERKERPRAYGTLRLLESEEMRMILPCQCLHELQPASDAFLAV